ncbi:MAG: hypothetical protein KJN60_06840 [Boseongicola sp.]|nr:hypothetical protein [Boseongicola sp.]
MNGTAKRSVVSVQFAVRISFWRSALPITSIRKETVNVAEISLSGAPILGDVHHDFGACTLAERTDIALISVAIPKDGRKALSDKLKELWELSVPSAMETRHTNKIRAIPMTVDQFMLAFSSDGTMSETDAQESLADVGYTTLQTDAWVILELKGSGAITALERICPIDLDQSAFPIGSAARTSMEHLGACIVRLEADQFWLMSARSSAQSFYHAVETSCRWTAS